MTVDLSAVQFDAQGLVPAVAQDAATGDVLLVAFMNAEALEQTLTTGEAYFWSRSRGVLWHKGATSGHTLGVSQVLINCEANSLLLRVSLTGPGACHEGYRSCYYRQLAADGTLTTIAEPVFDPGVVYNDTSSSLRMLPLSILTNGEGAGGWGQELARAMQALYAGYLRLRDNDYTSASNTSRMLHDLDASAEQFLARAREELGELQGVIDGTHSHSGTRDDILLEASQVIYWLCLAAARAGLAYADWQPDVVLSQPLPPAPESPAPLPVGRFLPLVGAGSPHSQRMERGSFEEGAIKTSLTAILSQVSALLAQTDVSPIEPVQRDLTSLLQRLNPGQS